MWTWPPPREQQDSAKGPSAPGAGSLYAQKSSRRRSSSRSTQHVFLCLWVRSGEEHGLFQPPPVAPGTGTGSQIGACSQGRVKVSGGRGGSGSWSHFSPISEASWGPWAPALLSPPHPPPRVQALLPRGINDAWRLRLMPENEVEGSGGREPWGGDPRLPHPLAAALGLQHGAPAPSRTSSPGFASWSPLERCSSCTGELTARPPGAARPPAPGRHAPGPALVKSSPRAVSTGCWPLPFTRAPASAAAQTPVRPSGTVESF